MPCRRVLASPVLAALAATTLLGCAALRGGAPPLRVGSSGDYAPFTILRDGAWSGMDVAIAERLGTDLGRRVELVQVDWNALVPAVAGDRVDVAMGGVTMRPERALVGRYTRPYAVVSTVLLVRASDSRRFTSVADLDQRGVRIAVNAGGHLERVARATFTQATVQPIDDNRAVPRRLLDKRADAVVTDTAELADWLRPSMRVIGPLTVDHKAYLLPAADAELAAQIDAWLVAREEDGWLDQQRVTWIGEAATMDSAGATREAVAALVRLRLGLMPAVAAAKRAAGRPIEDRAQEDAVLARVRAASARPEHAAAVYRELITLAKAVQAAAPPPADTASLAQLREAIARVDVQLVRELDRSPATSAAEWQAVLAPTVTAPGVREDDLRPLAAALAG